MSGPETLLIYAPVPLYRTQPGLMLEGQAINGLRLWAENFERLLVMMPVVQGAPPPDWMPVTAAGEALDRIEFHPLPTAFRPDRFLATYAGTARRIRALIARADYLSFAIGGLFGDWGAVACWQAHRMGRPYAVWTDRVESEVVRRSAVLGPWRHRLRAHVTHRPMALVERALIRRARLGLFHGRETFEAYAPWCSRPELVHDIHIARADHIPPPELQRKIAAAGEGPLRLCYVGRAEAMKGPLDWVEALRRLDARNVDFRARWLGEGSLRPEMRRRIDELGLGRRIDAPGFAADRQAVLRALRGAHLFVFCHQTPESPRNLIEALISGCPIVGYEGAFARDITAAHRGGAFVPVGAVEALADELQALATDRGRLAGLIARAARDGEPFDDVTVFRHRSDLIKLHLGPRAPT